MKPPTGEFTPVQHLEPGVATEIPAVPNKPVFLRLGDEVVELDYLGMNQLGNVPAFVTNPDRPQTHESIFYGADHRKIAGRALGGLALGPHVSREHLSVHVVKKPNGSSNFVVTDLHSMNGTTHVEPANAEGELVRMPNDYGYSSRASDAHPNRNEDACVVSEDGIFGVFDGVGGSKAGAEASTYAAQHIREAIAERMAQLGEGADRSKYADVLKDALMSIDNSLFQTGWGESHLTTATGGLRMPSGEVVIASLGDSRAYVLRNGMLLPLTRDNAYGAVFDGPLTGDETYPQNVVAEMDFTSDLQDEGARQAFRRRKFIATYLGMGIRSNNSPISITYFRPQKGDILLLSTDGVHDNLKDSEIAFLLRESINLPAGSMSEHLVENAHKVSTMSRSRSHRPKQDDITALVEKY